MAKNAEIKQRDPLFHIVKRDDMPTWKAWLVRGITILIGFLLVGFLSMAITEKSFGETYQIIFSGVFGRLFEGRTTMLWKYLQEIAILLCLALALTPAFKMKFWNCGAEGQALMGGLASIFCMINFGEKLPYPALIVTIIITSIIAGAVWGVIPAVFKALFNTNETLFTLMMNYIATQIIAYYVYIEGGGSNVINPVSYGNFPAVGNNDYFVNIVTVAAITVLMYVYLRYSKQGYEISVVGESQNTARYVGINVKKVIIRTLAISGAIAGVAGFLLVGGINHTISTTTVGGRGFTAIMVSWLAKFNPLLMIITSFLIVFMERGASQISTDFNIDTSISDILTGIILVFIIGCEFFLQYKIVMRNSGKEND